MGHDILIRSTEKLVFHNKIQQSSINITRLRTSGGRSNRSAKKIIVVGIGKVTQFSIILSHRDKQAIQHTSKQEASEKEANGKERANKTARVKWGEENERQMANNVNAREMGL